MHILGGNHPFFNLHFRYLILASMFQTKYSIHFYIFVCVWFLSDSGQYTSFMHMRIITFSYYICKYEWAKTKTHFLCEGGYRFSTHSVKFYTEILLFIA